MYPRLRLSCLFDHFITNYSLTLSFTHTLLGGDTYKLDNRTYRTNESVNVGDEWSMEVDLRSSEKEKRTLHLFVRGKQQKFFIKGVPERVEFGVCSFCSITFFIIPFLYLMY